MPDEPSFPNNNGQPPPESDGEPETFGPSADRFVFWTLLFEGSLAIVGLLGGAWGSGLNWSHLAQPKIRPALIGIGGGVSLFLMHILLFFPGREMNPLYRYVYKPFKEGLLTKLPEFSFEDIVFISIMSGIGEEILFRGWIQSTLGITVASVLFGLIHIWGREGIGYGLYAVVMGFILGYLYNFTGNLWAPVIAHTVNNFLGLYAYQSDYLPN